MILLVILAGISFFYLGYRLGHRAGELSMIDSVQTVLDQGAKITALLERNEVG